MKHNSSHKAVPFSKVKVIDGHFYVNALFFQTHDINSDVFSSEAVKTVQASAHDPNQKRIYDIDTTLLVDIGSDVSNFPIRKEVFYYAFNEIKDTTYDKYADYYLFNTFLEHKTDEFTKENKYVVLQRVDLCPHCGEECDREEVDVGVGVIYGPYGCSCGWSADKEYDLLSENTGVQEDGSYIDQYGVKYPKNNPVAIIQRKSDDEVLDDIAQKFTTVKTHN